MDKAELEELKTLREFKERQELDQLRDWKNNNLPKFKPAEPENLPEPPQANKIKSDIDEYIERNLTNNPVFQDFIARQKSDKPAQPNPNSLISRREAALKVKDHLSRCNNMFYIGAAGVFLSLGGYHFNMIAGGVIAAVAIVLLGLIFKKNRDYITELERAYRV